MRILSIHLLPRLWVLPFEPRWFLFIEPWGVSKRHVGQRQAEIMPFSSESLSAAHAFVLLKPFYKFFTINWSYNILTWPVIFLSIGIPRIIGLDEEFLIRFLWRRPEEIPATVNLQDPTGFTTWILEYQPESIPMLCAPFAPSETIIHSIPATKVLWRTSFNSSKSSETSSQEVETILVIWWRAQEKRTKTLCLVVTVGDNC